MKKARKFQDGAVCGKHLAASASQCSDPRDAKTRGIKERKNTRTLKPRNGKVDWSTCHYASNYLSVQETRVVYDGFKLIVTIVIVLL